MGNPPCGESPFGYIIFCTYFSVGNPEANPRCLHQSFNSFLLSHSYQPLCWLDHGPPRDCQEPYRSTLTVSTATVCELLQISKARSFCRAGSGWNWAIVGCHPTSGGFMDVYGFMSVELGLCWDEKRKGIELIGHTISYNLY